MLSVDVHVILRQLNVTNTLFGYFIGEGVSRKDEFVSIKNNVNTNMPIIIRAFLPSIIRAFLKGQN